MLREDLKEMFISGNSDFVFLMPNFKRTVWTDLFFRLSVFLLGNRPQNVKGRHMSAKMNSCRARSLESSEWRATSETCPRSASRRRCYFPRSSAANDDPIHYKNAVFYELTSLACLLYIQMPQGCPLAGGEMFPLSGDN